jgi:hypothetical protein
LGANADKQLKQALDESLKTISKYAIEPDNFDHLLTLASHLKIVEPIFKEWEELKFQMNK